MKPKHSGQMELLHFAARDGELDLVRSVLDSGRDVNELAERIRGLCQAKWESTGRAGEVPAATHADPRPGELQSSLVDAAKAKSVLGWTPQADVAEGLGRAVEWFAAKADC